MAASLSLFFYIFPLLSPLLSLLFALPIFIAIAAHFRFSQLGAVIVFLGALFSFQLDLPSKASANAAHSL